MSAIRTDPLESRLRAGAGPGPGVPPRLTGEDVAYCVHDTPVGPLVLARSPAGLVAMSYADADRVAERLARRVSPRVLRRPEPLDEVRRELDGYFAGRRHRFDLRVDLALATDFQRAVLEHLAAVPYGRTTTYGELARAIGRPTAARAVGAALGANPVCIVLPCHRVTGASGALTGYAGGVAAKRLLLDLEGGAPPLASG